MNEIELWSIERLRRSLNNKCTEAHETGRRAAKDKRGGKARPPASKSKGFRRWATFALVTAGVLWGAAFMFGKLAFAELPVSHVTLYRFTIASLVLLPVAFVRRAWPERQDVPMFLLTGFLIVPVTFLLQYTGLTMTSTSSASLIIGTLPPLLAVAGVWLYGERLSGRGWMAVGISTLGVLLIAGLPGAGRSLTGDALVFLSMIVVVVWVFLSKPLIKKYTSLVATAYLFAFGTLTLLPISYLWDGAPQLKALSATVIGSLVTLGLGCSAVTYALWNWGLMHVPTAQAGVYTNLEPLVGLLLGVMVLRESLSVYALLGGLLIVASAVLISLRRELA